MRSIKLLKQRTKRTLKESVFSLVLLALTSYCALLRLLTVKNTIPAPATRTMTMNGKLSVRTPVILGSLYSLVTTVVFSIPSCSKSTKRSITSPTITVNFKSSSGVPSVATPFVPRPVTTAEGVYPLAIVSTTL